MQFKINKKHIAFVMLYFLTMVFLLLDVLGTVPFMNQLRKLRFVYLAVMIAWYFLSLKNTAARDRFKRKSNIIIILGLLHTILFAYIFTNDIVKSLSHTHGIGMLFYFYIPVIITLTYVYENELFLTYTVTTYIACVIQLMYAAVNNLNHFVNPVSYLKVFSSSSRVKFDFGFITYGYTAHYCVFALVVSLLIFDILKNKKKLKSNLNALIIMAIIDFVILCMLASSAGRSGILTVSLIAVVYFGGTFVSGLPKSKKKIFYAILSSALIIILVALIATGAFGRIWADSNRDLNITVNYPVFKELGNIWTGMGYVENANFQATRENNFTSAFGVRTSSLDMYYVYLYFTTGIIGCVLIGSALLYLLYLLIKNQGKPYALFGLALYIGWLFYAFWQCNLLTYRYYSPWFYLVVLLYIIDSFDKHKEIKDVNENNANQEA
ncbi:MAG: hypothetical protein ACI3XA_09290 [Clostridia bacterium]